VIQPVTLIPVTIYEVVINGLATGLDTTIEDNPVAGDHRYCTAPEADKLVLEPEHITASEPADTTAEGKVLTKIVSVMEHPEALEIRTQYCVEAVVGVTEID